MPVSSFRELREKIRRAIRDTYGQMWDDPALDEIINEAQREYSILAGSFIGTTDAIATADGICACPADFIEAERFIGTDGEEKALFSWRYLAEMYPDFRSVTGSEIRGIVTDFDGYGKYRLFPKIPAGENAGKLYYKRLATLDEIETRNVEALEQHCLFQVFLLNGKQAASEYYRRFTEAVNEESVQLRGIKVNSRIRKGKYY